MYGDTPLTSRVVIQQVTRGMSPTMFKPQKKEDERQSSSLFPTICVCDYLARIRINSGRANVRIRNNEIARE